LLQGSERRADREDRRDRGEEGEPRFAANFDGGGRGRGGFDREAMEERFQNEIAKLPKSERDAAAAEHEQQRRFWDSLRDMTPEQRSAAIQQMMSDPNVQEKMDNASNNRDARRTPQQRIQRAGAYLSRMAAATGR
jgi:hypothetical protein